MDEETYDQFSLPHAELADELPYMQPNTTVQILEVNGKPSSIQLPASVELAVAETEPGVKGDTAHERHEDGDARDRRRHSGAALRQRRRRAEGRPERGSLHLPRVSELARDLDEIAAETGFSGVVRVDRGVRSMSSAPTGLPTGRTISRTRPTRSSRPRAARRD